MNQLKDEDLVGIDFAQIYVKIKEKEDLMEKAKMKSFQNTFKNQDYNERYERQ